MRRETAELIIEFLGDYFSNLYGSGLGRMDMTEHDDNSLLDSVLKIAKEGDQR
jgi:hypothetical protein